MANEKFLDCTNPATGEKFGVVRMTSLEEIHRGHQGLRQAFPVWSSKSVRERIRILRQFQKTMIDSVDEISDVITVDTGKTRQDAMIEVFITVDMLDQYRKHAERWLKPRYVPRGLYLMKSCHVINRPYGVVGVIAPWNYPFALAVPPILSALLAGNVVMFKPSEVTAAMGVLIESLFKRVPELAPYIRVFHGDGSVGAAMVQSGPDYIFLTGSTATGQAVLKAASEQLIPVACELGGKDAMIVLEDADVSSAARWGVWGSNFNTGQTCMAMERAYVVEPVYDQFVQFAIQETQKLKVGFSSEINTDLYMGPITDPRQIKIIDRHIKDALSKGARLQCGGKINGMFVEPGVMVDVDHSMLIMQEETFGPILPVMKVRDAEEAIRLANDCSYGLGGAVWSKDIERALSVAYRMEAGSIAINDTIAQFAVPMLPFGGIKNSGYGRVHGKEGLVQFTRPYAYAVGRPPVPWDVATIMREPGHYKTGVAIMQLAFGVGPQQRMQPVIGEIRKLSTQVERKKLAVGLGLAGALGALAFGLFQWKHKLR